ncbi:MAG: ribbon-helix-helix protein, CopG family [Thermofilum sp.]
MGKRGLYVRVDEELLSEFTRKAKALGLTRSEALRRAMEAFIASTGGPTATSKMRGLVKSKLTLRELEEAYAVLNS